ncbi:MAG: hypothetical protein HZB62_05220 [Nitrospirae bacterium]|nr:hypothetical protein [Nitrospirota bacterium]
MNNSLQKTFVAACLIIFLLVGCSSLMATPIKKIIDNPRDYSGKPVTVSGEVTELFSLFVIKYFVVKDSTGEIIVVTHKPLPKKGSKITAKGTVQEAFSIGDQQLIVIMEKE